MIKKNTGVRFVRMFISYILSLNVLKSHYQIYNIFIRCGGFLRVLSLRGCKNIRDSTIAEFSLNCPNMHTLNMSECKLITDAALYSLGTRSKWLRKVNLYRFVIKRLFKPCFQELYLWIGHRII